MKETWSAIRFAAGIVAILVGAIAAIGGFIALALPLFAAIPPALLFVTGGAFLAGVGVVLLWLDDFLKMPTVYGLGHCAAKYQETAYRDNFQEATDPKDIADMAEVG